VSARWGEPQALRAPCVLETAGHGTTAGLVAFLLSAVATLAGLL
jgi:hypothetical protein